MPVHEKYREVSAWLVMTANVLADITTCVGSYRLTFISTRRRNRSHYGENTQVATEIISASKLKVQIQEMPNPAIEHKLEPVPSTSCHDFHFFSIIQMTVSQAV
jgi:hypothetical protein